MGFYCFSGDGNFINFIVIFCINISGVYSGVEVVVGVLCGGGIFGFGFMNIVGGFIGYLCVVGMFKLFLVFCVNGVGWCGGDQCQGEGGEKSGFIYFIVFYCDSGVLGYREGYMLVYFFVGVRIK